MDMNCAYCAKGELVAKFGYEVCELPASTVYLFKEQSHPGQNCFYRGRSDDR